MTFPRGHRLRFALAVATLALGPVLSTTFVQAAEVTYVLRIENGHVPANMQLIRVWQDDTVKLQWTAEKPSIVHLHGYDIERRIVPGAVTELTFTARATGRFQVHLHGNAPGPAGHGHEDALVTIEVYPR